MAPKICGWKRMKEKEPKEPKVSEFMSVRASVCACVGVGDWGRGGMCEIEKENEMAGKEESMDVRMCVF